MRCYRQTKTQTQAKNVLLFLLQQQVIIPCNNLTKSIRAHKNPTVKEERVKWLCGQQMAVS